MPGLTRQQHEAAAAALHLTEPADQPAAFVGAADEGCARGLVDGDRRVATRGRCVPPEARILREDLLLERAELRTGLDAELLDEHVARLLVGAQRVGLTARAVQGEHEQLAEPLPDRVLLGEPLGLDRDRRVAAPLEIDRELGLQRDEVQLLQALALGLRPGLVGDVGEWVAAPQRERVGEVDAGVVEATALAGFDGGGHVALEAGRIDLFRRDVEHVARWPGHQHGGRCPGGAVRLEHPPQVRHVGLEGRRRRGRRLAVPELVDQAVDRDDPSGLEEEQRQERPVFGRAELQRALLTGHREGPEQRELQPFRRQGAHSR